MKGDAYPLIEQQIHRWVLEQKAALEAQRPQAGEAVVPRPIITVSRELGSGGTELAELVADRLGYTLFDKEVIEVVAREAGVQREIFEGLDERTRSGIEQWVDGVLHRRIVTSQDFVRSLAKTLITVARTGSAVVVGRGANFILAGEPALHVRVVAGREYRLRRFMRVQGIEREEAGRALDQADRDRAEFVQKYLHQDLLDVTAFDLVLNLERIGLDRGVNLVMGLYRDLFAPR
jgi:cytidylate kinase